MAERPRGGGRGALRRRPGPGLGRGRRRQPVTPVFLQSEAAAAAARRSDGEPWLATPALDGARDGLVRVEPRFGCVVGGVPGVDARGGVAVVVASMHDSSASD